MNPEEFKEIKDRIKSADCPVCGSWCTKEVSHDSYECHDCKSIFTIHKRGK